MSYKYKDEIIMNLKDYNAGRRVVTGGTHAFEAKLEEIHKVYSQAAKSNEYEAKNKKLLEELKYLKKVNDDLVWQRDTDEEHEAKAKAFDDSLEAFEELKDFYEKVRKTTERGQIRAMIYKEVYSNVLREMKLIYEESGESDA